MSEEGLTMAETVLTTISTKHFNTIRVLKDVKCSNQMQVKGLKFVFKGTILVIILLRLQASEPTSKPG